MFLKTYEGDISDLSLTFVVAADELTGSNVCSATCVICVLFSALTCPLLVLLLYNAGRGVDLRGQRYWRYQHE
jgi:hypothetical protein